MTQPPDQRLLEEDFASPGYRAGAARRLWGRLPSRKAPASLAWPRIIIWIAAAIRDNAPNRFHFLLDATGYRARPLTGTVCEPVTGTHVDHAKRPKGRPGSRFGMVFRTDWNNGTAFYHPYDRIASESHPEWLNQQPHLVWTPEHTIVDFLKEFHGLLQSKDYVGI